MKILKEAKEKLPVSFLTDFISRGWDDVGYLKETIKSINENFSGTKKVEDLLQALLDAYLVCIGQLEMHLEDKDYLEMPEEAKKLTENVDIHIEGNEVTIADNSGEDVAIIPIDPAKEDQPEVVEVEASMETPIEKKELPDTDFDFFVDFDEPAPTKEAPLSDEEIEKLQQRG